MTAEVVIMNQGAVAMAADSAVTIRLPNGDKKIYNSANKLFALSKYHPVGIMVFNNAKLLGLDWEIIIKQYRKQLQRRKFNTIHDYYENFIEYLNGESIFSNEVKRQSIVSDIKGIINMLATEFGKKTAEAEKIGKKLSTEEGKQLLKETLFEILESVKDDTILNCTYEQFVEKYNSNIEDILASDVANIDEALKELVKKCCYHVLSSPANTIHYTGVVIAGYGEEQLFPAMTVFLISGLGEGFTLSSIMKEYAISFDKKGILVPFAQSEMISSFMDGIDPEFNKFVFEQLEIIFTEITSIIPLAQSQINDIYEAFKDTLKTCKQKYFVSPIVGIIESLPKNDLAEMAESLVNLTAFKRHVSPDAETVGGPTDVAIISKTDGFIWKKRKHYFDPALNQQFFEKYYMEECNE